MNFTKRGKMKRALAMVIAFTVALSMGTFSASADDTVTAAQQKTAKTITAEMVSLSADTAVYTGAAVEPAVKVTGLTAGKDYTVEYKDNVNAGTAMATVKGAGDYLGCPDISISFTITPAKLDELKLMELTQNVDYIMFVETDGTKVYSGIGNYTGLVVIDTDMIMVGNIFHMLSPSKVTITGISSGSKYILVKYRRLDCDGYQIVYSRYKSFSKAGSIRIMCGDTTSKVIKNLTKGKKYYIKVRAFNLSGDEVKYGSFSRATSITCR